MSTQPFQFKQFTVAHDRCAAKIGTDGVLLGAWTSIEHNPDSILDIGTGTGIIALMLAQRSVAQTIDALELDDDAYEQATQNFEESPWGDRLFCYHAHLHEFASEMDEQYDLVVCNPPFYKNPSLPLASLPKGESTMSESRKKARFQDAMPFELLVGAVLKLLSPGGTFNVIIPYQEKDTFIHLCAQGNLFPKRITRVKGTLTSDIKRCLLEFSYLGSTQDKFGNSKKTVLSQELVIEKERHSYTPAYVALVKDFYLKM
jgi:tRNA1Val (adenine37-N6)-methyltransferase